MSRLHDTVRLVVLVVEDVGVGVEHRADTVAACQATGVKRHWGFVRGGAG